MASAKVQTGLRLDETLYQKFKFLADMDGRSLNNLAEYVIRQYVAEYEAKNGPLPLSQD